MVSTPSFIRFTYSSRLQGSSSPIYTHTLYICMYACMYVCIWGYLQLHMPHVCMCVCVGGQGLGFRG